MKVAVIDYGMGNLKSVINAFDSVGADAAIVDDPARLAQAERIVLPGVGAFARGMQNLREGGWCEALEEQVRGRGKPFLGFCVGMQLLVGTGHEHGVNPGLGWIAGDCVRLTPSDPSLRVPHIGWNDATIHKRDGVFRDLGEAATFYFVHSYAVVPQDPSVVAATCDHGGPFAAAVEVGNIAATQFHPEKSQHAGLKIIENFLSWRP
ncbi:imidazole glycerol phosphate synthase subunit HisH [Spirulina sp. CCNP1310]|uniref:imidazole glycerol phosphate synthase subunit HisH n=1 Tax=Spirulina sp. CCNP1310 TaxID=3110249 RepID=UPI002B2107F6|nr:imidazole glycerol phosphate synthase subunit HisH [Spirulina sp. CCNP1310]MEA5419708.1 imidazole glycerol phosphate synthase subunit HisH [Spirulina sp. CCNP1310]